MSIRLPSFIILGLLAGIVSECWYATRGSVAIEEFGFTGPLESNWTGLRVGESWRAGTPVVIYLESDCPDPVICGQTLRMIADFGAIAVSTSTSGVQSAELEKKLSALIDYIHHSTWGRNSDVSFIICGAASLKIWQIEKNAARTELQAFFGVDIAPMQGGQEDLVFPGGAAGTQTAPELRSLFRKESHLIGSQSGPRNLRAEVIDRDTAGDPVMTKHRRMLDISYALQWIVHDCPSRERSISYVLDQSVNRAIGCWTIAAMVTVVLLATRARTPALWCRFSPFVFVVAVTCYAICRATTVDFVEDHLPWIIWLIPRDTVKDLNVIKNDSTIKKDPFWEVMRYLELSRRESFTRRHEKVPYEVYRDFVLDPRGESKFGEISFRPILWRFFVQRSRDAETSKEAAEDVLAVLKERFRIDDSCPSMVGFSEMWQSTALNQRDFLIAYIGSLRAIGVPTTVGNQALEIWTQDRWVAPRKIGSDISDCSNH